MNTDYAVSDRRHFLKHLAGLSALAFPGMHFLRALRASASELQKNNKSLIVLWLSGGPPTIDMWDLKPGEPTGGEFRPMPTSANGVQICQLLPSVAKQMKHLSIVRALRTNEGDHMRGRVLMHTARVPNPIVNYPSIGSVVSHELTPRSLALPGFISIGRPADGPGFLGMNYAPFTVQNPGQPPANIRPPDMIGRDAEQMERVARRRRLFVSVEDRFTADRRGDAAKSHSEIYDKAYRLIASPLGKVFNLGAERKSLLEEYGTNGFGQGCLLARRLVEAGVTCVEIDLGGWDLHAGVFPALKNQRLPMLDKGMGAFVRDLVDRGLWKNTVLVCMGEFGRTPRINQNAGRDHWARCWSVVLGGGALNGGQVFGATDKQGLDIKGEEAATVGDLFATIYKGLGLDPAQQIRDNLGRPLPIAEGKPIKLLV
jgi:hypothetical protein